MLSSLATSQTSKGLGHVSGNTGTFIGLSLEKHFPLFPLLVEIEHQLPSFFIRLHLIIDALQVISFGILPYHNWGFAMRGLTRALYFFQFPMYDSQIFGMGLGASGTNGGSDGPNSYAGVFSAVTVIVVGVILALLVMLKNVKTDDREIEYKVLSTKLLGLALQNWVYFIASVALIPILQNLLSLAFCYYGSGNPMQLTDLTAAMTLSVSNGKLSSSASASSPVFSGLASVRSAGKLEGYAPSSSSTFMASSSSASTAFPISPFSSASVGYNRELYAPIPILVVNTTLARILPPTRRAVNGTLASALSVVPAVTSLANSFYGTSEAVAEKVVSSRYRHLLWFPDYGCGVGSGSELLYSIFASASSSSLFAFASTTTPLAASSATAIGGGLGVFSSFGLALCIVGFFAVFPLAFFMNTVVFDIIPTSTHPLAKAHSMFDAAYVIFKLFACVLMHYFLSSGNAQSTTTIFKGSSTVTSPTGLGYYNQPLSNEDGHEVPAMMLYYAIFIAICSFGLMCFAMMTLPFYHSTTNKIRITTLALCFIGAILSCVSHIPTPRHYFMGERTVGDVFGDSIRIWEQQRSDDKNGVGDGEYALYPRPPPLTPRQSIFFSNVTLPVIPTNPLSGRPYYTTYFRDNTTQDHVDIAVFLVVSVLTAIFAWFVLSEWRFSTLFKRAVDDLSDGVVRVRTTHFPRRLPAGDDIFEDFENIVTDIATTEVLQDVRVSAALSTGDDYTEDRGVYHFTTPTIDDIYLSSDVELSTRFLSVYKDVTNGRPFTASMLAFAAKIYCKGVAKYRHSARVRLAFSYFLACFASKGRTALLQLQVLRGKESSLAERYHAWRLYTRLANALHVNESVSLEAYTRAKRRHREGLQFITNFWQILVSDEVDSVALADVTRSVQLAKKEVGEVYVLLLTKFAGHMDLVSSFAQYCQTMALDPDATAQTLQCLRELRDTKKLNAVRGARIRLAEKDTLTQLPLEIIEEEEDAQANESLDSIVGPRRVLWVMAIFMLALLLGTVVVGEVYAAKRDVAIDTMLRCGELRSLAAESVVAAQNLVAAAHILRSEEGDDALTVLLAEDYTTTPITSTAGSSGSTLSSSTGDGDIEDGGGSSTGGSPSGGPSATTTATATPGMDDAAAAGTASSSSSNPYDSAASSPSDLTAAALAFVTAKTELLALHDDFRSLHNALLFSDLRPSTAKHKEFVRALKFIPLGDTQTLNYWSMGHLASIAVKDIIVNPLGDVIMGTRLKTAENATTSMTTIDPSSSSSAPASTATATAAEIITTYSSTSTSLTSTSNDDNKMLNFILAEFPNSVTFAYNRSIDYYADALVAMEWECMVIQLLFLSAVIAMCGVGMLLLLYFDRKIEGIRADIFSLFSLIPKRVCKRLHRDAKRRLAELEQFFVLPTKLKVNYLIGSENGADGEEGAAQLGFGGGGGENNNSNSPPPNMHTILGAGSPNMGQQQQQHLTSPRAFIEDGRILNHRTPSFNRHSSNNSLLLNARNGGNQRNDGDDSDNTTDDDDGNNNSGNRSHHSRGGNGGLRSPVDSIPNNTNGVVGGRPPALFSPTLRNGATVAFPVGGGGGGGNQSNGNARGQPTVTFVPSSPATGGTYPHNANNNISSYNAQQQQQQMMAAGPNTNYSGGGSSNNNNNAPAAAVLRTSAHQSRLNEANDANLQKARANRAFLADAVFHGETMLGWFLFFASSVGILVLLILSFTNLSDGIDKGTLERPLQSAVKAEHVAVNQLITAGRGFIATGERGYLNRYVSAIVDEPDVEIRRAMIMLDATAEEIATLNAFSDTLAAIRQLLRISVRLAISSYPVPGVPVTLVNSTRGAWVPNPSYNSSLPSNATFNQNGSYSVVESVYTRSYSSLFTNIDNAQNVHAGLSYTVLANVTWPQEEGLLFIKVCERLQQLDFRDGLLDGSVADLKKTPSVQLEIARQTVYSYQFLTMVSDVNEKIQLLQSLKAVEASRKSSVASASTLSIIAASLAVVPLSCIAFVYYRAYQIRSLRLLKHPLALAAVLTTVAATIISCGFAIAPPVMINNTGFLSDAFSELHAREGEWFQHVESLINYPRHFLGSKNMLWLYMFRGVIGEDPLSDAQLPVYGLDPYSAMQTRSGEYLVRKSQTQGTMAAAASFSSANEAAAASESNFATTSDDSAVDFVWLFNDFAYRICNVGSSSGNEEDTASISTNADLEAFASPYASTTSTASAAQVNYAILSSASVANDENKRLHRRQVQQLEENVASFKQLSRIVVALAFTAFSENRTEFPLDDRRRAAFEVSDVSFIDKVEWDFAAETDYSTTLAKYYLDTDVWYSNRTFDMRLPTREKLRVAVSTAFGRRARDLVTAMRSTIATTFEWLAEAATETYTQRWYSARQLLVVAIAFSSIAVGMAVLAAIVAFVGYTRHSAATLQRKGGRSGANGSSSSAADRANAVENSGAEGLVVEGTTRSIAAGGMLRAHNQQHHNHHNHNHSNNVNGVVTAQQHHQHGSASAGGLEGFTASLFNTTTGPLISCGVIMALAVTLIVLITIRRDVCVEAPTTLSLASERSWLVSRSMAHAAVVGSDRSTFYRSQKQLDEVNHQIVQNIPRLYFKNGGTKYFGALSDPVQDRILFARSNYYSLSKGVSGAATTINSEMKNPYTCSATQGELLLERVSAGVGLVFGDTWLRLTRQVSTALPAQLPNLLVQMEYYYKALMLGLSISTDRYAEHIREQQTHWHSVILALTVVLIAFIILHHAVIVAHYLSFLRMEESSARLMLRIIPAEARDSNPQISAFIENGKLMGAAGAGGSLGVSGGFGGGGPSFTGPSSTGRGGMFLASQSSSVGLSGSSGAGGLSTSTAASALSPIPAVDPSSLVGLSFEAQITALSTQPVITIDQQGIIIRFTSPAEYVFGYKAHEVIGRNVSVLMPPDIGAVHDSFLANYRRTRIPHAIGNINRLKGMRKNGKIFPFELTIREIKVSDDERYFVGIGKDLSTQMELDLQDRLNDHLLDLTSDCVVMIDHYGLIKTVNRSVQHVFGYGVEELVGENCKVLMTPSDAAEHDSYLRRYHDTGIKRVIDTTRNVYGQRKNGEVFAVSLSVREIRGTMRGEPPQFIGFIRDVSENVTLEQQSAASEIITSLSPTPVMILTRRGVFVKFSTAAEKLFGYSSEELVKCGMNVKMLLDQSVRDHEDVIRAYLGLSPDVKGVVGSTTNIVAVKKNGEKIPVRISVTEVSYDGGSGSGSGGNNGIGSSSTPSFASEPLFVVNATDITQIQKAEGQLQLLSAMREWSVIPIVGTTSQGIITSFNAAAAHAFKWAPEDVIGRNCSILMPAMHREHHHNVFAAFHASRCAASGGSNYNVSVVGCPALNGNNGNGNNPNQNQQQQRATRGIGPNGVIGGNNNSTPLPPTTANVTAVPPSSSAAAAAALPPSLSDWVRHETAVRRDNTTFPVKITLRETCDPHTQRSEVFAFIEDVTETRSTAQKLMVNESLLSLSPIPIIAIDGDGRIELFSAAAEQCFGYSAIEVIGENIVIIMPPELRPRHDSFLQMFHKSAKKFAVDATLTVTAVRRNGSRFPCEVSVREVRKHKINNLGGLVDGSATTTADRLKSGNPSNEKSSFVAYLKEMSSEGQLLEARALGSTVALLSPTPIIQATVKGIITYVNPATCREFRFEPRDLIGKNIKILMEATIADRHDGYMRAYEMSRIESRRQYENDRDTFFTGGGFLANGNGYGGGGSGNGSRIFESSHNVNSTTQHFLLGSSQHHGGGIGGGGAANNGGNNSGNGNARKSSLANLAMHRSARLSRSWGQPNNMNNNLLTAANGNGNHPLNPNGMMMLGSRTPSNLQQMMMMRSRRPSAATTNNNNNGTTTENSTTFPSSAGGGVGVGGAAAESYTFWREAGEYAWYQFDSYFKVIRSQAKRSDNSRFDVEISVSEIPRLSQYEQDGLNAKAMGTKGGGGGGNNMPPPPSAGGGGGAAAANNNNLAAPPRGPKARGSIMTPLGDVDSDMINTSEGGGSASSNKGPSSGGAGGVGGSNSNNNFLAKANTARNRQQQLHTNNQQQQHTNINDISNSVELLAYIRNLDLQRRLERANETIDVIVNMSIIPIVAIDSQGVVIIYSSAAEQAFEYRSDEVLGSNVKMLMPPEVGEKHDSYLKTYFKTNIKTVIGNVLRQEGMRRSGARFPLELAVKEIVKIGHPTLFIAYLRPVANDTALEQATQLSQTIITQSPVPVIVINRKGIIRTFNEAAVGLTGYPREEVLGLNVALLMEDADAQYHDAYLRLYAQTGIKKAIDANRNRRLKTKEGRIVETSIAVREVIRSSGEVLFVGFIRDLTRELELQTTSIVNDVVASLSPIPLICINEKGIVIKFNAAAERDFRYSANEVLGENVKILMPEETAKKHDAYMARFAANRLQQIQQIASGQSMPTRATGATPSAAPPPPPPQMFNAISGGENGGPQHQHSSSTNGAGGISARSAAAAASYARIPALEFTRLDYGRRRTGENFPIEIVVREVRGIYAQSLAQGSGGGGASKGVGGAGGKTAGNAKQQATTTPMDATAKAALQKTKDAAAVTAAAESVLPEGTVFVGFIRDLTSHFETEHYKALHETAVEISPVPIISIQPDGAIITFNRAASDAFKYSFEEVHGKNVRMLMMRETAEKHDMYLQRYLHTGIKTILDQTREVFAKQKSGKKFPAKLLIKEIKEEDRHYFIANLTDISIATALEHAWNINDCIVDMSDTAIVCTDSNGIITKFSRVACEVFKCQPSDVIGKDLGMLMTEGWRQLWSSSFVAWFNHHTAASASANANANNATNLIGIAGGGQTASGGALQSNTTAFGQSNSTQHMNSASRNNNNHASPNFLPGFSAAHPSTAITRNPKTGQISSSNNNDPSGLNDDLSGQQQQQQNNNNAAAGGGFNSFTNNNGPRTLSQTLRCRRSDNTEFTAMLTVNEIPKDEKDAVNDPLCVSTAGSKQRAQALSDKVNGGFVVSIANYTSEALGAEEDAILHATEELAQRALIVVNGDGVITRLNHSCAVLFGYPSKQSLLQKNVRMLMPTDAAAAHDNAMRRYLKTGQSHLMGVPRIVLAKTRQGQHIQVELLVTRIHHKKDPRRLVRKQQRNNTEIGGGVDDTAARQHNRQQNDSSVSDPTPPTGRSITSPTAANANKNAFDANDNDFHHKAASNRTDGYNGGRGGIGDTNPNANDNDNDDHHHDEPEDPASVLFLAVIENMHIKEELSYAPVLGPLGMRMSPVPLVVINREGTILDINPACCSVFDFSREQSFGRNVGIFMPSGLQKQHDRYLAKYFETGVKRVIDGAITTTGETRTGQPITLRISVREIQRGKELLFIGALYPLDVEMRSGIGTTAGGTTTTAGSGSDVTSGGVPSPTNANSAAVGAPPSTSSAAAAAGSPNPLTTVGPTSTLMMMSPPNGKHNNKNNTTSAAAAMNGSALQQPQQQTVNPNSIASVMGIGAGFGGGVLDGGTISTSAAAAAARPTFLSRLAANSGGGKSTTSRSRSGGKKKAPWSAASGGGGTAEGGGGGGDGLPPRPTTPTGGGGGKKRSAPPPLPLSPSSPRQQPSAATASSTYLDPSTSGGGQQQQRGNNNSNAFVDDDDEIFTSPPPEVLAGIVRSPRPSGAPSSNRPSSKK